SGSSPPRSAAWRSPRTSAAPGSTTSTEPRMAAEANEKRPFDLREFLFRHRDHVPVPVGIAALVGLWFYHPDFAGGLRAVAVATVVAAAILIVAGEALRIWAVGHSGRTTRAKDLKAPALAT